jgi:hypothetical protein
MTTKDDATFARLWPHGYPVLPINNSSSRLDLRKYISGRSPRYSGRRHLFTDTSRMPAGALSMLLFCGFSACLTAICIRTRNRTFTCGMSTLFRIFFQVDFLSRGIIPARAPKWLRYA